MAERKVAAPEEDWAAFKSEQGFRVWVGGAPLSHYAVAIRACETN
jgi:hypothetical protein